MSVRIDRTRGLARALATCALVAWIGAAEVAAGSVSFSKSSLAGEISNNPTTLQFGPDGRLYVGQQNGLIHVYTIVRNGPDDYAVSDIETISSIQAIPNHDDDGTANGSVSTRLVTGLLVTGTALQPVVYVASSDPRIGAGSSGTDLGLDTNSGVISRLTWNGTTWDKLDLVRGLPRSEENHASNGLQLDEAAGILYVCQGGHTNQGATSNNFALLPEYALSAAILSIDLTAIGEATYDLPTLDDEDRPGDPDAGDPFGGNNAKNQAMLVPGGPVQVHSTGWRNAYDLVIAESGKMYAVDNGPNSGWGDVPAGEGTASCTNAVQEPGTTRPDNLHYVAGPGYYAGHPNPTRADPTNTFNASNPQSPVTAGNPVECDYRIPGSEDGALATFNASTNGLAEYTATNFAGAMQGDLLLASFDDTVKRVQLDPTGTMAVSVTNLFASVGNNPLDLTTVGDTGAFPGTIWVANHGDDLIQIYEPVDFSACTGDDDPGLDEDADGYTNADEIDNGSDPCSPGDFPPDWDGDLVSNLNDPDDDDDGTPDTSDPYAIDPTDGIATGLPLLLTWENDDPDPGGLAGLGWTGLMTNGGTDYESLFDLANMTAGGAAGVATIDLVDEGTARGPANDQAYGFQRGLNVDRASGRFTASTRILGPFAGLTPAAGQAMGLQLGTGDQSDYVELVLVGDAGGGVRFAAELGDVYVSRPDAPLPLPGPGFVDLMLTVDTVAGTVQPSWSVDGGAATDLGGPEPLPGSWLDGESRPAVGMISTSAGPAPAFPVTWDHVTVLPETDTFDAGAALTVTPAGGINASTYGAGSFQLSNTSTGGQRIVRFRLDIGAGFLPDMVFDPAGTAGDTVAKCFTVDVAGGTGLVAPADPCVDPFDLPHDNGYDALEIDFNDFDPGESFGFSVDIDPTSIQGSGAPGPNDSGSVSGLELTGARVTVEFDDGSVYETRLYRVPASDGGSQAFAEVPLPPAPGLEILGLGASPSIVADTAQVARITGPPGSDARLLVVEGGLYTAGLPGGGFDLDPFEVNSAIGVQELSATLDAGGVADLPVTLGNASTEAGIGYLVAVLVDGSGRHGATSNVWVVEVEDCAVDADCDDGNDCTQDTCAAGACQFSPQPVATSCEADGSLCTADACDGAGACLTESTVGCPPGEICDPLTGTCDVDPVDDDNDGLPDSNDPCPLDPRNLCFGPVAIDGAAATPVRLNAGVSGAECSGQKTDCNGDVWYADFGYNLEGSAFACNLGGGGEGCVISGIVPIFGCEDESTEDLFQCEHWDDAAEPELIYSFDLPDGNYLVNLLFANAWNGSSTIGTRVFDILAEGVLFHDDFDTVLAAGGDATAVVRSLRVAVADGNGLQIELQHVVQNPALKALEVLVGCPDDLACDDLDGCTSDVCSMGVCLNDPPALPGYDSTLSVSPVQIAWTLLDGAAGYDLLRGDLGLLRSTGDLAAAGIVCAADDHADTWYDDVTAPPAGHGWFYLLRGINCGGAGSFDSDGPGQAGPRDAAIEAAPGACP